MATGIAYESLSKTLWAAGLNFTADTIKCALLTSAYTPNRFTDEFWGDINAAEVTGTAYTVGGATLSGKTITDADTGIIKIDSTDPAWATATISGIRYAAFYKEVLAAVGGGIATTSITSNVATVGTVSAHGLTTGALVTIAGVNATYNGTYILLSGSGSTMTFTLVHADDTGPTTGTVSTPNPAASPLISYIDFLTDQSVTANNLSIALPTTGIISSEAY
jgi:hypothetical protein